MSENSNHKGFPVISLFSGAMGLDLGLEKAGFTISVAVECDKYALETIRYNRPDLPVISRRIEDVSTKEILDAAGLEPGDPVVVIGGPSCQTFSTAGQRASLDDPRGTMFEQFIRIVREVQARFFVMENVRGLLSAAVKHRPLCSRGVGFPPLLPEEELGSAFRIILKELRKLDYYVIFDLLNAADYGVPQRRERLIFIGSRNSEYICMPQPTHSKLGEDGLPHWRTLSEAISRLNEQDPEYYRFRPAQEKYLKLVPEGGNWRDLPADLQKEAIGSAYKSWGGRSGFLRRLSWDKPSPALTTRPDGKATTLCHPAQLRPLTVREYALIQQFPDDWELCGPVRKKYEQIGNAVPLGLGEAIGQSILKAMESDKKRARKGVVECWNIDLLTRLNQRPRTIVNPPRMRDNSGKGTISDWYDDLPRKRGDALTYTAPELVDDLRKRIGEVKPTDKYNQSDTKHVDTS